MTSTQYQGFENAGKSILSPIWTDNLSDDCKDMEAATTGETPAHIMPDMKLDFNTLSQLSMAQHFKKVPTVKSARLMQQENRRRQRRKKALMKQKGKYSSLQPTVPLSRGQVSMITLPETDLIRIARDGTNTKSTQDMTPSEADWSLYTTRFIGTPLCASSTALGVIRPPTPSNETSFVFQPYSPREEMERRVAAILERSVPQFDIDDMQKGR